MARGKRERYIKKPFESTGVSSDVSANLYLSMLTSPAWLDLSAQQKALYTYCKLQLYGEKSKPTEDPATFTMNQYKWRDQYQLYKVGNERSFYRDMTALIEHGFISCVKSGAYDKKKSIYRFSSKWQEWGTAAFDISTSEMTYSMTKKRRSEKG